MSNIEKKEKFSDAVQFGLEYIAEGLLNRRKAMRVRQVDYGFNLNRIKKLERGEDGRMSTFLAVLEKLDILDEFLDALPFAADSSESAKRIRQKAIELTANESNILEVGEPVSFRDFRNLIDKYPDKEIPITLRTAPLVAKSGFASRRTSIDGKVTYLGASLDLAKESEHEFDGPDGKVGGVKRFTLTIARAAVTQEAYAERDLWMKAMLAKVNAEIAAYRVEIVSVDFSRALKETTIRHGNKVIRTGFLNDLVNEAINNFSNGNVGHE